MYLTSINPTWVDPILTSIDPCPESSQNGYSVSLLPISPFLNRLCVLDQEKGMMSVGQNAENQDNTDYSYVELAVDVLRSQHRESIQALKDFLTVLPNPCSREHILILAVYQLAEVDREACRWILRHSSYLMPELDVKNYGIQWVYFKLQTQGFIVNQDFRFGEDLQLKLTRNAELELWDNIFMGDRLILEEIFNIHND